MMPRIIFSFCLIGCIGCAGNQHLAQQFPNPATVRPVDMVAEVAGSNVSAKTAFTDRQPIQNRAVKPVAHDVLIAEVGTTAEPPQAGTLTINGRQYKLQLVDSSTNATDDASRHSLARFRRGGTDNVLAQAITAAPLTVEEGSLIDSDVPVSQPTNLLDLNLPTALAMIDGGHPAVGFAQWQVQEAYAELARAEVLWLPSIQAGFSFHRHDGNYQASNGDIVDVNRNSFQYGLGTGATGAGTTNIRPGLVARFHMADAIFQPKIAKKTAWARGHAAKAVVNEQLLRVATAYLELLDSHQDARILEETRDRAAELSKITSDFAQAGRGLQADADRMQTELSLVDNRLVGGRERIAIASARLAQTLSIDAASQIMPLDVTALPLQLVSLNMDKPSLIATALATRPELKESQALVAAACEAFCREKYAPLVPSVLLGFSTGGFGGGLGNDLDNIDGRYDFDALMSWEVRNLGFGERAARRESSARIQQAKFEKLRVMDRVAREISESYSQVQNRGQQMTITQRAIQTAEDCYKRNLARIRDGQGLPLEVLQSLQALESARRAYLRAVIDHNQAQFRLQWALGWPVNAPPLASSSQEYPEL